MILIVSHQNDIHTQYVMEVLKSRKAPYYLLNLSEFPEKAQVDIRYGAQYHVQYRNGTPSDLDLTGCRSVWWRRPQSFNIPKKVSDPVHRMFATSEAQEVFGGIWGLIRGRWINEPYRDDLAHRKVYQLKVAGEVGFDIPNTRVTNDPVTAQEFIRESNGNGTIYKAFNGTPQAWRETRLVGASEIENLDKVAVAPVIFQEYVRGADVRVTVVDGKIFAAEIDVSTGDYPVDFRMNYDHMQARAIHLPDHMENAIGKLMQKLGLIYGAIDLKRTGRKNFKFLEINPAGQWLFIEKQTAQPITETVALALINQ